MPFQFYLVDETAGSIYEILIPFIGIILAISELSVIQTILLQFEIRKDIYHTTPTSTR